jgi:uncharacterized protein (TIGR02271 family)
MISKDQVGQLQSGTVLDSEGNKIGSVGAVYFDDRTNEPDWVTVKTGVLGTSEAFVPLAEASLEGDNIRLPFAKDKVKDAPRIDVEDHLDLEQERELYRYYGLDYDKGGLASDSGVTDYDERERGFEERGTDYDQGETDEDTRGSDYDRGVMGETDGDDRIGGPGNDMSGPNTDEAMTRSEERLNVGKQKQEAGRARLRKYVVTEEQSVTVPVTREEAVIEREPITDANRDDAMSGPAISEEAHEVTLHEERPVVEKEAVPVERVKLGKEQVTEDHNLSEEVRKERIETDGDIAEKDR